VQLIESEAVNEIGTTLLKGASVKQQADHRKKICAAEKITAVEHETLKEKANPNQDEQWHKKIRRFEHELCIDLDTLSLEADFDPLFNLWNQGRGVKPIQGLGEAVLSREHAQTVTEYLLKHKHPSRSLSLKST
jgi:hypothetical protein